jgi:hypothetical protein
MQGQIKAGFRFKMRTVEEKADETIYWMEWLIDTGIVKPTRVNNLMDEANQISFNRDCFDQNGETWSALIRNPHSEI